MKQRNFIGKIVHFVAKYNLFDQVIVFDTSFGYTGHSRACYDYLTCEYPDRKISFISKKNIPVRKGFYQYNSCIGIILTYFCKYQFYTVSAPIFQNFDSKITVQFWHGTPIKSLGRYDSSMTKKTLRRMIYEFNNYKLIILSDLISKNEISRAFCVKRDIQIAHSPYLLTLKSTRNISRYTDTGQTLPKQIIRILYAPTYRKSSKRDWDLALNEKWIKFCEHEGLSIKYHYHPSDECSGDFSDILEVLPAHDLLITDYSSLYFDAVKIGLCCILYQPDLVDYEKERGLCARGVNDKATVVESVDDLTVEVKRATLHPENINQVQDPTKDKAVLKELLKTIGFE